MNALMKRWTALPDAPVFAAYFSIRIVEHALRDVTVLLVSARLCY